MMKSSLSEYLSRTAIKIISNLHTVKFEENGTLKRKETEELNCFPQNHYKLFAGFVKTLDPVVILFFCDNYNEQDFSALSKYFRRDGKIIAFLSDSPYVCRNILPNSDTRIKIVNDDFSGKETLSKYAEIIGLADLIFCDDKNVERVKVLTEFLQQTVFIRNPLLIINNTNIPGINKQINEMTLPSMSLSSFNTGTGTSVIEIKHQKSNPLELAGDKVFSKLHIGCGYQKLPGFINVDVRPTEATDLVHSCINFDDFPRNYFDTIYSHAFFEHLNADDELICLKNLKPLLTDDGKIVFLGIPDFEIIAKSYTNGSTGPGDEKFGLMQVYRYTHGAPEQGGEDWWFEQLHKSVFDRDRILTLLTHSEIKHFVIFRYFFRDEKLPLNLGFFASQFNDFRNINAEVVYNEIRRITGDITNRQIEILFVK